MKKILTVLLALSVVFTYTVGSAFAAAAETTDKDKYDKMVEEARGKISYTDGSTAYLVTEGAKYDNLIEKGTVDARIDSLTANYAKDDYKTAPKEAEKFLDELFETNTDYESGTRILDGNAFKEEYIGKPIVFVKKGTDDPSEPEIFENKNSFKKAWLQYKDETGQEGSHVADAYVVSDDYGKATYKTLLNDQRTIEKDAADEALAFDPVGMGYTEAGVKQIKKVINEQKKAYTVAIAESDDAEAIRAFREIVEAIEDAKDVAPTTEDEAESLDGAKEAVFDAIDSKSEAFISAIKDEVAETATEKAKQKTINSDAAKMVRFFEDKADSILSSDETNAKKVNLLNQLRKVVLATFSTKGDIFDGEFYKDLTVLEDVSVFETYAYNVAIEKKAERNADGTVKYYTKDVDRAYDEAIDAIAEAAYTDICLADSETLNKSTVDDVFADLVELDYELQGVKEEAIDAITVGDYASTKWIKGERQDKVIAIQEKATEDILNAETIEEIETLEKQAKADMDAILNKAQIDSLNERTDNRIKIHNYEANFSSYYDVVVPATGYSDDTKKDVIEDAVKFLKDKVVEKEDADLSSTEIDAVLTENYSAALEILKNVLSDAELAAQAAALDTQIAALPTVITIDDKDAVLEAWENYETYEALAGADKADLKNYKDLESAYDDLVDLEKTTVRNQIRELPTVVTVADKEVVEAARTAVDALYDTYEVEPSNLSKLIDIEEKLEAAKLKDAIDKVSALGSDPTQAEVEAARAAYDGLKTESKLKFNTELYADLLKAEESLSVNVIKDIKALKLVKNHSTAGRTNGKSWIRIEWKTVGDDTNVDGYQIYRSTKPNSGYEYKFTSKAKWYKNTAGLKKGTRYYYKVRAFVEVDGQKYYSDWSNKAYRYAK